MTFNIVTLTAFDADNAFNHFYGSIGELGLFVGVNTDQVLFLKPFVGIEEEDPSPTRLCIIGKNSRRVSSPNSKLREIALDAFPKDLLDIENQRPQSGNIHAVIRQIVSGKPPQQLPKLRVRGEVAMRIRVISQIDLICAEIKLARLETFGTRKAHHGL